MNTTRQKTGFLEYDRTLGVAAMENRGFYYPVDIAINGVGRIYGLSRSHEGDPRGVRVCIFDLDSNFYGVFGSIGEADGQFTWATSIAIDRSGLVYVSDEYTERISIFDADGKFLKKWGTPGPAAGELAGPASIVFDHSDVLFVSDHRNNRIQRFTKDGTFLSEFGCEGAGDGQFNLPWGITVSPSQDIYIADWRNDRIQRFSPKGDFIAKYGGSGSKEGELSRPSSLAVDEEGYMYVADWGNERIQVLDPEGGFVQTLRGEATLSPWAQQFLDASPSEAAARLGANLETAKNVRGEDTHTESSHIERLFWAPTSVKIDMNGLVYITDRNRHRIQVYRRS